MTENVKMYNCWVPPVFYHELLHISNKNCDQDEPPVTARELELNLHLIFLLAVYGVSLNFAIQHKKAYPLVGAAVDAFVGGEICAQKILKWLDVAPAHQNHYETIWDTPFQKNVDLKNLKKIVSNACSNISFKPGISDIIIDDDKMHNRSVISSILVWV